MKPAREVAERMYLTAAMDTSTLQTYVYRKRAHAPYLGALDRTRKTKYVCFYSSIRSSREKSSTCLAKAAAPVGTERFPWKNGTTPTFILEIETIAHAQYHDDDGIAKPSIT